MRTLGIDLATQDNLTGVCRIDWQSRRVTARVGRLPNAAVVAEIRDFCPDDTGADWIAIDAPFGYPLAFSRAVAALERDSNVTVTDDGDLTWRLTDRHVAVRQSALRADLGTKFNNFPLSSVASNITPSVIRCAAILTTVQGGPIDRVGLKSRIIETYPAAVMRAWNVDPGRYKARDATPEEKRDEARRILARLETIVDTRLDYEDRSILITKDDALDAFVCALVASAVARERKATGLESFDLQERAQIEQEGWIHLPPASALNS